MPKKPKPPSLSKRVEVLEQRHERITSSLVVHRSHIGGCEVNASRMYTMLGELAKRLDALEDEGAGVHATLDSLISWRAKAADRLDTLQRDMQERVAAADDRYDGLGGYVDGMEVRLRAIENLLTNPTGNMQGRLDALEQAKKQTDEQLHTLDLEQKFLLRVWCAPKPKRWYQRGPSLHDLWQRVRDWFRSLPEPESTYNADVPMTKGAKLVKVGWSESDGTKGERYTWTAIDDNAVVSAINTNGETFVSPEPPKATGRLCKLCQRPIYTDESSYIAADDTITHISCLSKPCPTCHDTDPLCMSVGAPHGNNDPIQPSVIFYEGGAAKIADATAEVNRLAREIAENELAWFDAVNAGGEVLNYRVKFTKLAAEYVAAKKREGEQ
jgi:hypothetical protein